MFIELIAEIIHQYSAKPITRLVSLIMHLLLVLVAKGFELNYQPDDETEIVRDLLYDMTNRVICQVDHTADKTGVRKCRPGVTCCFFKKFHKIDRPPTPVQETIAKRARQNSGTVTGNFLQ